jgi:hypothetical protein
MTTNCYFRGPQVGTLRCSCSGAANVFTCFNAEQNPTGLCSDYTRAEMPEGKIAVKGVTPKDDDPTYMIFPYRQKDVDAGYPLHDDWILRCDQCPWHRDEDEKVADVRLAITCQQAWLKRYQDAESLEARELVVQAGPA